MIFTDRRAEMVLGENLRENLFQKENPNLSNLRRQEDVVERMLAWALGDRSIKWKSIHSETILFSLGK
jgi:hypothetical protein